MVYEEWTGFFGLRRTGNLAMRCTEECILGVKGNLPEVLLTRPLGKEILYGKRTGNTENSLNYMSNLKRIMQKILVSWNYLVGKQLKEKLVYCR
eukprot:snap_masked-scaffold_90-processed-gene-0.23-mRNA-1 protein AED:1.00 eAED:1.00 QI:0/0/0/0/1/1/2/0/93